MFPKKLSFLVAVRLMALAAGSAAADLLLATPPPLKQAFEAAWQRLA